MSAVGGKFSRFPHHMVVENPIGIMLAALLSLPKLIGRNTSRTLILLRDPPALPGVLTTMDTDFCVSALEDAINRYGVPKIFNTDQGSQSTSYDFIK